MGALAKEQIVEVSQRASRKVSNATPSICPRILTSIVAGHHRRKVRPGLCRGRCAPLWRGGDGGGLSALRTRAAPRLCRCNCPELIEFAEVRRFYDAFELLPGVADYLKSASRVAVPINAGTRYGGSRDPAAPFAVAL